MHSPVPITLWKGIFVCALLLGGFRWAAATPGNAGCHSACKHGPADTGIGSSPILPGNGHVAADTGIGSSSILPGNRHVAGDTSIGSSPAPLNSPHLPVDTSLERHPFNHDGASLDSMALGEAPAPTTASRPAPPAPIYIGHDTSICPGMFLLLHAGAGYQHYAWSTGDTSESIIVSPGHYSVIATDSLGLHTSNTRRIGSWARPELGITSRPIDCKHAAAVLTLHPDGGAGAPYAFALEGGTFTRNPVFPGMAPGDYVFRVRDSMGCLSAPEPFTVKGSPERTLLTSVLVTGAHCPGSDDGSIQVNIDHGTPPFTFSLDGQDAGPNSVFSHLFAGPHTVIVQTDFCADTLQVTVSGPPPLYFSPVVGDETRPHNGRIALHPGGGTPPYNVSWEQAPGTDTVLEHLPAATYTVHLLDGAGCGADTSIVVRSSVPATTPALTENKNKKSRESRKR